MTDLANADLKQVSELKSPKIAEKLCEIGDEFFDREEFALAVVIDKKAIEIDPNSATQ